MITLVYVLLLAGSVIFHVAYRDNLSLIFLIIVVALSLLFIAMLIWARVFIKVELRMPKPVVGKGESIPLEIKVTNKSIFPIMLAEFRVNYHNAFMKNPTVADISTPIHGRSSDVISSSFISVYSGLITVSIEKLRLYDFFRLFNIGFCPKTEAVVSVLPRISGLSIAISPEVSDAFESDLFSKTKPGDDPSEVFDIRGYRGGDKQNRIHWKLSAKQEEMLVKEYSLPVNASVMLLLEFSIREKAERLRTADALLETTFSIAQLLQEQGFPHALARQDGNVFSEEKIASEDDINVALTRLLRTMPQTKGYPSLSTILSSSGSVGYSHIIYITATLTKEALSDIEKSELARKFTIIELCSEKLGKLPVETIGSVQLYRVPIGAIDALDLQI